MKKAISVLTCLLFVLTTLYPVGTFIAACVGYRFELISVPAFAVAIAILSLCVIILDIVFKNKFENKQALFAIMTPLSFINAVFYIFCVSSNLGNCKRLILCVLFLFPDGKAREAVST